MTSIYKLEICSGYQMKISLYPEVEKFFYWNSVTTSVLLVRDDTMVDLRMTIRYILREVKSHTREHGVYQQPILIYLSKFVYVYVFN